MPKRASSPNRSGPPSPSSSLSWSPNATRSNTRHSRTNRSVSSLAEMDHPEHGETPAQHPGAENDQDPGRPRSGSTGRSKKRGLFSRLRHPSAPRNPSPVRPATAASHKSGSQADSIYSPAASEAGGTEAGQAQLSPTASIASFAPSRRGVEQQQPEPGRSTLELSSSPPRPLPGSQSSAHPAARLPGLNFGRQSDSAVNQHADQSTSSEPANKSSHHHIFPSLRHGGSVRRTGQRVKEALHRSARSATPPSSAGGAAGRTPSSPSAASVASSRQAPQPAPLTSIEPPTSAGDQGPQTPEERLTGTPITTTRTNSFSGSSMSMLPMPGGRNATSAPNVPDSSSMDDDNRSTRSKRSKFHLPRLHGRHGKRERDAHSSGEQSTVDTGSSAPVLHSTRSTPALKGKSRSTKSGTSTPQAPNWASGMSTSIGLDAELERLDNPPPKRPVMSAHSSMVSSAHSGADVSGSNTTINQPPRSRTPIPPPPQSALPSRVDLANWSWDDHSEPTGSTGMKVTPSTTTLTGQPHSDQTPRQATPAGPRPPPAALSMPGSNAMATADAPEPSPPPDLSNLPSNAMFGETRWRSHPDARMGPPTLSPSTPASGGDASRRQSHVSGESSAGPSGAPGQDSLRVPGLHLPSSSGAQNAVYTASPATDSALGDSAPAWSRTQSIHQPSLAAPGSSVPQTEMPEPNPQPTLEPGTKAPEVRPPPGGLPGRAPSNWSAPESWAVEPVIPPGAGRRATGSGPQASNQVKGTSTWMAPPSWAVDWDLTQESSSMQRPSDASYISPADTRGGSETASKGASTWMAPESWAVQGDPGTRDAGDGSDEDEARRVRGSSDPEVGASVRPLVSVRSPPTDPLLSGSRPRRSDSSGRDTLTSLAQHQSRPTAARSQSQDRLPRENSVGTGNGLSGSGSTGLGLAPTPPLSRSSTPTSLFPPSNESASAHRPSNATTAPSARSDLDYDGVEEMADSHAHGQRPRAPTDSLLGHPPDSQSFSLFRRKEDASDSAAAQQRAGPHLAGDARADYAAYNRHHIRRLPARPSGSRGGGGALAAASGAVGTAASILGLRTGSPRVPGLSRYAHHHHRDRDRAPADTTLTPVPSTASSSGSAVAPTNPAAPVSPRQVSQRPSLARSGSAQDPNLRALANMGLTSGTSASSLNDYMPSNNTPISSLPYCSLIGRDVPSALPAPSMFSQSSSGGGIAPETKYPAPIADEDDLLGLYRHIVQTKEPVRRLARSSVSGSNAMDASSAPSRSNLHLVRIYRHDGSFTTLRLTLQNTAAECKAIISRKVSFMSAATSAYRLFVRDKGAERPLGPNEKPAMIQRRRLIQAGYNDSDGLEDMGKEDLSYFIKFIFRPDIVPGLDSQSFGNDKAHYADLDLHGRNLEMVPIFLYRHADWIIKLDLSGNPMSDIPADFVQMCTSLRTLRLTNLALKCIPSGVRVSHSLAHLDVSNNRILQVEPSLEGCTSLQSINVLNNRLYQLPSWMPRVETLTSLNLSNNLFDVFPTVVTELMHLRQLDMSFNNIQELPPEINRLQDLQHLILVGNSLKVLPEQMADLSELETVDLRRNLLHDVSVLFRMPRVNVAKCEHNAIRHFEATLGEKMRILEVGQNPMTKVSLGAFSSCELTSLNLSSTNMARLDESLFRLLPSLTELILDRNQFVTLPDSLGDLSNLVVFSCNNNNLATLPDSIGNLRQLHRLNVQNNNLKRLPTSIWNCASLYRLNVTSNLLEAFPTPPPASNPPDSGFASTSADWGSHPGASTTSERQGSVGSGHFLPAANSGGTGSASPWQDPRPLVKSLRRLRVADNHLADDVFTILRLFTDLEVLNLSFNEIYEVPSNTLSEHKRLHELYLSGNSLTSVPEDLFGLKELRVLFLNGNKLQTLPTEMGQLTALVELDVGNNNLKYNIANWTYDWNWNNNPELRYLNLSGNQRFEIKAKNAQAVTTRDGRRKNLSNFCDLHSLRVLGLMDVTVAAKSTPDELINRRVRTSLSKVNEMSYGIADALGDCEALSTVDVVVPMFREVESEALLAMFDGRDQVADGGSKISRFMAEGIAVQFEKQLALMAPNRDGSASTIEDCLRRCFLQLNSLFTELIMDEYNKRKSETRAVDALDERLPIKRCDIAATPEWTEGCSAIVAYIVDHDLYVANAGDALAVLSHNGGQAELIATKHEPFDRDETQRIRTAEGWVSLRGCVNDALDVSRGFGYYHLFPVVNAAPAVHKVRLSDSDEFVIIANRSLWEFLSYQTAVDIARMERDDPMIAAQRLRDLAISYGSDDSIMVMVLSVADLFGARNGMNLPATDMMRRQRGAGASLPADRTLARLEREIPPPIGQIALVFTDIKSSTHLWETNSGMHTAMRIHNTLLRRQLRTVAGFESKVEGDGMMASFSSVSAALLWCFNVQIGLLNEDWPQELLESEDGREIRDENGNVIYRGLRLRMGIHWGSPVCEPDPITGRMDYFGPMVNRASRIASAADGGQICVSKDVVQVLTDTIGAFDSSNQIRAGAEDEFPMANESRDVILLRRMGFGITEVGFRRLKGLETPELLYLVYPRPLIGRLEQDRTFQSEAHPARVFEPTVQLLDAGQVRQVGLICLRVEALSAGRPFPGIMEDHQGSRRTSEQSRMHHVGVAVTDKPELLICMIHDDASDEELALVLVQLAVRLANAVAKLTLDMLVDNMPRIEAPTPADNRTVVPHDVTDESLHELSDPTSPAPGEGPFAPQSDSLGMSLTELQQLVRHLRGLTTLLPVP